VENYFSDDRIIDHLCNERIKLAERCNDRQYIQRLIGRHQFTNQSDDVYERMPPRRQWNAFRARNRSDGKNPDLLALKRAVLALRQSEPNRPWVRNLNRFTSHIQNRVLGNNVFAFSRPAIHWEHKKGNEYRALCRFDLEDNLIACLFAHYLRDALDAGFSSCSYAYRTRNVDGILPTHHLAFDDLFKLREKYTGKDRERFVGQQPNINCIPGQS
jgi:hypothetical protein